MPPLTPEPQVLAFLAARRSRSARTLVAPGPDRAGLLALLTLAARVPDHGKLEPWRFVVLEGAARERVGERARDRATALGLDADKAAAAFTQGPVIVAVLSVPRETTKIPAWEQTSSAAAVCTLLLLAASAAGWGANWLTGPLARDADFIAAALGGAPGETVAGFVHIGTETVVPEDRPRPDIAALTTWA